MGFPLRMGGGLSTEPQLAKRLDAFVRWNQVVPAIRAVAEVFREADVLPEHRERARFKYLFLQHGWTAENALESIQRRLPHPPPGPPTELPPPASARCHPAVPRPHA